MPSENSSPERASPFATNGEHPSLSASNRGPVALALLGVGCFEALVRYLEILTTSASPHPDVTTTWRPVAEAVLAGTPLYLTASVDNKPPLFEYLNLAVAATNRYLGVFLLLVGLANGTVAYLLWRVHAESGRSVVGLAGGVLFLAAVPLVNGHAVNARSFTLVGMLLALRLRRATCGLAVASAGLLSQYGALAAPAVLCDRLASDAAERRPPGRLRWGVRFVGVAVAAAAVGYASVFLVWGEAAFAASLDRTLWASRRYVFEWTPSLWNGTETWAALHRRTALTLWHLLSLAAVGVLVVVRRGFGVGRGRWSPERRTFVFAASFCLPLFVRPFPTYWVYLLPWLATLSAVGLFAVVGRVREAHRRFRSSGGRG
ncbi:hypothetical protein [Haladaptatus salinisoli]|uniref:hypothetical protein n=1 Tax=Haladaptatus salinisoli TaxID=2884876 RepID=UPI001D0B9564|nr:hypothetical protein [Haladaptatus salinisoli]